MLSIVCGICIILLCARLINPGKVKLSLTSQEGSEGDGMLSIHPYSDIQRNWTAELSALRAGLREFLEGRVRLSGQQGY